MCSSDLNQSIEDIWGATAVQTGADVVATAMSWNSTINPGRSVTFGFVGDTTGPNPVPASLVLNGSACT